MKKRILLAGLAAALGLCLSGCVFDPVDKLYALPALPQEYKELQATIDATMSELGAEYATINYGSNTSTIQLLDMDGDGRQETAAVFLRVVASAEEKPMRVCLFRQGSDQRYRQSAILAGAGTSINSVAYEDLTGDGSREIIVSWQLSTGVHSLSVHSFGINSANELMSATYNEGYITVDLDEDGGQELLVFQRDITGEGYNVAEYFDYQDGVMVLSSTGALSDGLKDVVRAEAGRLSDGRLGVYVTLEIETGWLTDVLTLEPGGLVNVTRDPEHGVSASTCWDGGVHHGHQRRRRAGGSPAPAAGLHRGGGRRAPVPDLLAAVRFHRGGGHQPHDLPRLHRWLVSHAAQRLERGQYRRGPGRQPREPGGTGGVLLLLAQPGRGGAQKIPHHLLSHREQPDSPVQAARAHGAGQRQQRHLLRFAGYQGVGLRAERGGAGPAV